MKNNVVKGSLCCAGCVINVGTEGVDRNNGIRELSSAFSVFL